MTYEEEYSYDGDLLWKGVYVNGEPYGCFYYLGLWVYYFGGNVCASDIVDMNNEFGYCYIWGREEL